MTTEVRLGKVLTPSSAQTPRASSAVSGSGKVLPSATLPSSGGNSLPGREKAQTPLSRAENERELNELAQRASHYLRESGRAISFRVQSAAGRTVIQEVNPDTGEIIAELTSAQLLSLAHGLGLAGHVVDERA